MSAECCPTPTLAIVDPDPEVVELIRAHASHRRLAIDHYGDGASALLGIGADPPHGLLVHPDIAKVSVPDLIATVRTRFDFPILVGVETYTGADARAVQAAGATACVGLPYEWPDIAPVLRGVLRHDDAREDAVITYGDFTLDRCSYVATHRGRELDLRLQEFRVLEFLIERGGHVATKQEIGEAAWPEPPNTNTVIVHVKRLRAKLGDDPTDGTILRTVRGAGYRLDPTRAGVASADTPDPDSPSSPDVHRRGAH